MLKRDSSGKKGRLLCCKGIFHPIKANLAEIQPKNHENVQKTHFLQKAPGVNGISLQFKISLKLWLITNPSFYLDEIFISEKGKNWAYNKVSRRSDGTMLVLIFAFAKFHVQLSGGCLTDNVLTSRSTGPSWSSHQGHYARLFHTLTMLLSTQVYKWVPTILSLGVMLQWTSIPSRWGVKILVGASCYRNQR